MLATLVLLVRMPGPSPGREMLLELGDEHTGRALEVGVLDTGGEVFLVVHVMDLWATGGATVRYC